ncbi:MAG: orotate phosphoribosyltransferase [Phycisphaerae bacterium]|nr:orotate phosphoribosyltransferase [Phycisphaerae bacterium]
MTDQELAAAIRKAAYLEGDFLLRSGKRSKYYLDKYLFETQPAILRELGARLAKHVTPETKRIAGAELGAVALAAATSMACGLPFVIVRNQKKDYGTSKLVEGKIERGDVVLIVEDVATTGGQAIEAVKSLTDAGAVVQKLVAVIDRQEGAEKNFAEAGVAFEAILTKADLDAVA